MSALWTIKHYVSVHGVDAISDWFDDQTDDVRAGFLDVVDALVQTPHPWRMRQFRLLHVECRGLGEIRYKAAGVEHRALGFYSGGAVYTIVLCAIERNSRFVPPDACRTAQRRMADILANPKRCCVSNLVRVR